MSNSNAYLLAYFRQIYGGRVETDAQSVARVVTLTDSPFESEFLHFAWSRDGRHWNALNENKPIWNQRLRDPFVGARRRWRVSSAGDGRRRAARLSLRDFAKFSRVEKSLVAAHAKRAAVQQYLGARMVLPTTQPANTCCFGRRRSPTRAGKNRACGVVARAIGARFRLRKFCSRRLIRSLMVRLLNTTAFTFCFTRKKSSALLKASGAQFAWRLRPRSTGLGRFTRGRSTAGKSCRRLPKARR